MSFKKSSTFIFISFSWLAVILFSLPAHADHHAKINEDSSETSDNGWMPLFIGVDPSEWQFDEGEDWRFEGDELIADAEGDRRYVKTNRKFSDFQFKLEFWTIPSTNSGIFFRCKDGVEINFTNCYEANIWDDHPNPEYKTGSIVDIAPPEVEVQTAGSWSTYEVIVQKDRMVVIVNGKITARAKHEALTEGFIALQYGGKGEVRFRNIFVREL